MATKPDKALTALLELERRIKTNDPSVAKLPPEKKAQIAARLEVYREQGIAKPLSESSLTEAQGKATGFYNSAIKANKAFEASFDDPTTKTVEAVPSRSYVGQWMQDHTPDFLNSLPAWMGNSKQRQLADQSALDFVMASLRQESGAQISESELQNQYRRYFPMPGDGPDVIAQKAKARLNAIEGLKVAAGSGATRVAPPASTPSDDDLIKKYLGN